MRESIHKYFQIGTIQWMSYPPERYDLLESVRAICANPFFSVLEITAIQDMRDREKVKDMLRQAHMKVGFGAQPILMGQKLNPNDLDEGKRKEAELVLRQAVDEAEEMGAEGIAFCQAIGIPIIKTFNITNYVKQLKHCVLTPEKKI